MTAARIAQSQAADQHKKIIAGVAGALIAAGVLYFELADPGPKAAAPTTAAVAPVVGPAPDPTPRATANAVKSGALVTTPPGNAAGAAARTVGSTSAALDPTLHMQAMLVTESVVYNGSGRNIFAAGSIPAAASTINIPKPLVPVRTSVTPPVTYTPSGPAPPPPIDLKFFGTASTKGRLQAFLLHGDDVFLAADGDIVQRKYKVVTVAPRSVKIEDMTNNNIQTLPLIVGANTQ